MENTSMGKVDVLDNRASNILPSAIPYPSNVAMCYPPQPPLSSPLADGNHGSQGASNYLVPPAMTSPSGCLTSQQMYPNYPSPYYRTMLAGSQQGSIGSYYGTMLPTGHHSSAFYGSFYNPGSSTVYPGGTQPTLTPINYYSPSIYMQNHETVWGNTNQPSSQPNQNKKTQDFENLSTNQLPSCSKADSSTSQPPTAQDTNIQTEKQPTSQLTNKPPAECPTSQDLEQNKEQEFLSTTAERPPSKPGSVCSVEEETTDKDSDDESAEEEEDVEPDHDTSSSYSSCSYDSYTSEDFMPIENDDILENVPENFLNDASFGEIEQAKQDLVDDDLQCLLCNNFDHLIPRLDIAERLEPVVGEPISKSSVLLCTQCDLMLERYLSLEKEVQTLQAQIQSMYQNNKQHIPNKGDAETIDFEQLPSCGDDPNMCLNGDFPVGELNSQSSMMEELKSVAQTERFQSTLESVQQQALPTQEQSMEEVSIKKAVKFLTCDKCGKPYPDSRSLQRHVKQSHPKRDKCQSGSQSGKACNGNTEPLHCDQCNRDFERRSHYAYHVRVHHGTRQFKCQVCDKAFVTRGALTTHSRIHSGEKPFVCETCGRGFNVNSNLLAHIPKCTGQLPFKCDQCDKAFATRALQQIHVKTHQGEYAAKCETCGMGFTKKSHLIAHQRIHTKEKPFQCPICGKAFASLGNCNSHAKTHVDERKYVCEICGKKFARRQALDSHLNRHNGVKPYKCDVCDKSFHDPSNLTNHKKTHRDDS